MGSLIRYPPESAEPVARAWLSRTMVALAPLVVLVVFVGCAPTIQQSVQNTAEQAQSTIEQIKICAANSGADAETAAAKPPGERTAAEHALLAALEIEGDVQQAQRDARIARSKLDGLLVEQRTVDAEIARLTGFKDELQPKVEFFIRVALELFTVADAIAEETDNRDETFDHSDITFDNLPRRVLTALGGAVTGMFSYGVTFIASIGAIVGDIVGEQSREDQLREIEIRKVNELNNLMREIRSTVNANEERDEYEGIDRMLLAGIEAAQTFLEEVADPDRELRPKPMLRGIRTALDGATDLFNDLLEDLEAANARLDEVTADTQQAFADLNAAEDTVENALLRAQAALEACNQPSVLDQPSPQDTWWFISSP